MASVGTIIKTSSAGGAVAAGAQREDVSDLVYNLDPTETPVLSAIPTTTAIAIDHAWPVDELDTPAENKHYEGATASVGPTQSPVLKSNAAQILKKTFGVSGTAEVIGKYGRDSELAYEGAKKSRALKNDFDFALCGLHVAKNLNEASAERQMAPITSYLSQNTVNTTGTSDDGTAPITPTPGGVVFTQAQVDQIMEQAYAIGGRPRLMVTTARNKTKFSVFDGVATSGNGQLTRTDRAAQTVYANADIFVSNFGTLEVVPSRHVFADATPANGDDVLILDPEYLKVAYLRPWQQYDLAKVGDRIERDMLVEATLEVCNEQAHGVICAAKPS